MARVMLPRFYPIFDGANWLARTLPLGVQFCQLRVKNKTDEDTRREVRESLAIARRHGTILVINDHWQLAIEEGAEWVHLGQEDLDEADLPALRRTGVRLGVSRHDHAELDRALSLDPDYVALGPVYPTTLKKMRWTEQGLERVTEWKARLGEIPLCAIGGITVERAGAVFNAGADIVSVVSDVSLNANPESRVREWLAVAA